MCCNALKEEFSFHKLFFQPVEDEKSLSRQCCEGAFLSGGAYLLVKGVLCSLMVATVIVTVVDSVDDDEEDYYMIYLTNWGVCLLTLTHLLGFLIALFTKATDSPCLGFFNTAAAFLRSLANPVAFVITLAYWSLVYDGRSVNAANFMAHALNTIIVIFDIIMATYTVRILHVVWGMLFGAIYAGWSGIHYAADIGNADGSRFIYSSLSWAEDKVGGTIITVAIIMLIVIPLCYLACFGLAALRNSCLPKRKRSTFNELDAKV
eukprot:TRINITY_DN3443_c0_g1_i1.p1 TRINITY_DN3443_c0_g1~~TRINITY_DN3443_c0_g1_i1.p1  ORF type:complete len:280 (+),score=41.03 TRINITY_DN3443_c0_g1_i1:53-841(+)